MLEEREIDEAQRAVDCSDLLALAPELLIELGELLELQNLFLIHHSFLAAELYRVLLCLRHDQTASHVAVFARSELEKTREQLVKTDMALAHEIVFPEHFDRMPIVTMITSH